MGLPARTYPAGKKTQLGESAVMLLKYFLAQGPDNRIAAASCQLHSRMKQAPPSPLEIIEGAPPPGGGWSLA